MKIMNVIFRTKYGKRKIVVRQVSSYYLITYVWYFIPFLIVLSTRAEFANFNVLFAIIPKSLPRDQRRELIIHELVHVRQFWRWGILPYIILYKFSKKFRFKMEMEAFIEQLVYLCGNNKEFFMKIVTDRNSIFYKNLNTILLEEDRYQLAKILSEDIIYYKGLKIGYAFYLENMFG